MVNELTAAKAMGIQYNVTFRVLDATTGDVVSEHIGHNQATNSLLLGIAHYLKGDGILNQGIYMLSHYVPKYISLGCMGLVSQDEDPVTGLPAGIGVGDISQSEEIRFTAYMNQVPGYGADGYDPNQNNSRQYLGLGPEFANRSGNDTVRCELISPTFPRAEISYRQILPETESELPETIDIVYSAMISTGALAQFRPKGHNYLFITESGLWSTPVWSSSGDNGLLAGYRVIPPNEVNWDMSVAANREILKHQVLRVGVNQVVQVIWKIQIGSIKQFGGLPHHCDCTCPDPTCPCHGTQPPPVKPTTLTLNEHALTLDVNDTSTLVATVSPDQNVTWSTSDSSVVTVSNGVVTAIAAGTATITATATDGSGAHDTCEITTRADLPIEDFEMYTVFSIGNLILGANVHIEGEYIGVSGQVDWEAGQGSIVGDSNSHMYVLGQGSTTGVNAAIASHGDNVFNTNVHLAEGCTVYLPNSSEVRTFPNGLQSMPANWTPPVVEEIHYTPGTGNIILSMGENVVITTTEATIISPNSTDGFQARDPYYRVLPDGQVITGYVRQVVDSSNENYGAYKAIALVGSIDQQQHCYILPGTYAVESFTEVGNYNHVEFIDATASTPIIFYVDQNMTLSNNNFFKNEGDLRACLIYCGNNFISELANEMRFYIMAPNGTVEIRQVLEGTTIEGSIYADTVILGNNVSMHVV